MGSFARSLGLEPEAVFQRLSIDVPLRTRLWNVLKSVIWDHHLDQVGQWTPDSDARLSRIVEDLARRLWRDFLNLDLDKFGKLHVGTDFGSYAVLKNSFMKSQWLVPFEMIQFLAELKDSPIGPELRGDINKALELHNSAYRLVGTGFVEITSEQEIKEVQEAIDSTSAGAKTHLSTAVRMLGIGDEPDYRNSIKESLSAIEAECRIVTGNPKATLEDALKQIKHVHGAMNTAFRKLYAYGGDEPGVRHALTAEDANCNYADAKFMLVACAAFVNYLRASVA